MIQHAETDSTPRLLRRDAASAYVRQKFGLPCSVQTLAKLAVIGGGPIFQKAGRYPVYSDADLDAWAATRLGPRMRSTSAAA